MGSEQWMHYIERTLDQHAVDREKDKARTQVYERDPIGGRETDLDEKSKRILRTRDVEAVFLSLPPRLRDVINAAFFANRSVEADIKESKGFDKLQRVLDVLDEGSKPNRRRLLVCALTDVVRKGAAKDGGQPLEWIVNVALLDNGDKAIKKQRAATVTAVVAQKAALLREALALLAPGLGVVVTEPEPEPEHVEKPHRATPVRCPRLSGRARDVAEINASVNA